MTASQNAIAASSGSTSESITVTKCDLLSDVNNSNNTSSPGHCVKTLKPLSWQYPTIPDVAVRPRDRVDYRPQGGPLLEYIWLDQLTTTATDHNGGGDPDDSDDKQQSNSSKRNRKKMIAGQSLYLGAEVGCDNRIYFIPGHAPKVLVLDPSNQHRGCGQCQVSWLSLPDDPGVVAGQGRFKWLRGVVANQGRSIYGLPCQADVVLKIDVMNQRVTYLRIPYEEQYSQQPSSPTNLGDHTDESTFSSSLLNFAEQQRQQPWKYHGGAISTVDGCIYAIPQSAQHVLQIDPITDRCRFVGPPLPGKYKWYGGVLSATDGAIYGIPHNATSVLRIAPQMPSMSLSGMIAARENDHVRVTLHGHFPGDHKWHGAALSANGTIVCVPANADAVLCITPHLDAPILSLHSGKNDNTNDNNHMIQTGRHRLDGKYKYLGASAVDNCVYCFPAGSEYVLQIDTAMMALSGVTASGNCRPGPVVSTIGPNLVDNAMERLCQNKWQNGVVLNHRHGRATVVGIPLAAESVLLIECGANDNSNNETTELTPHVTTWPLPDPCKGLAKWEGAIVVNYSRADDERDQTLQQQVAFAVPNNFKAILRIELLTAHNHEGKNPNERTADAVPIVSGISTHRQQERNLYNSTTTAHQQHDSQPQVAASTTHSLLHPDSGRVTSHSAAFPNNSDRQGPPENAMDVIYRSGIPTLRSSAHRVKHKVRLALQGHDPPVPLLQEDLLPFDCSMYYLAMALTDLLRSCDTSMVGYFRNDQDSVNNHSHGMVPRLEDFCVPVASTWRGVNGGQCEAAQRYLSDAVASNAPFLEMFDQLVVQVVLPYLKRRLQAAERSLKQDTNDDDHGNSDRNDSRTFYYQRPPTVRLQPGPAWAQVKPHNDAVYGHQPGELNFWLPLTDRELTKVDLMVESALGCGDYHPIPAQFGQIAVFHGSSCRHFVNTNTTRFTRVSLDFRVGIEGYFDAQWQMQGTSHDHDRQRVTI